MHRLLLIRALDIIVKALFISIFYLIFSTLRSVLEIWLPTIM